MNMKLPSIASSPYVSGAAYVCPHCTAMSDMTTTHEDRYGRLFASGEHQYTLRKCSTCGQPHLFMGGDLVWPAYPKALIPAAPADMTCQARELYEEARAVLPISRRAAAALARASLEVLLKAITPDVDGGLNALIAAQRARASDSTWQLMTLVRVVGNSAVHADQDETLMALLLDDDQASLVQPILTCVLNVYRELVEAPSRLQEAWEVVPPAKRAAAEEAASKFMREADRP